MCKGKDSPTRWTRFETSHEVGILLAVNFFFSTSMDFMFSHCWIRDLRINILNVWNNDNLHSPPTPPPKKRIVAIRLLVFPVGFTHSLGSRLKGREYSLVRFCFVLFFVVVFCIVCPRPRIWRLVDYRMNQNNPV